jgi:hypothetical protein
LCVAKKDSKALAGYKIPSSLRRENSLGRVLSILLLFLFREKNFWLLYCFFIFKVLDRYQQDCEKLREILRQQTAKKIKLIALM